MMNLNLRKVLVIAIVSVLFIIIFNSFYSKKALVNVVHPILYLQTTEEESNTTTSRRICLEGTVTVQNAGRLGNKIMEYLSAWSLAKMYHMKALVSDGMHASLSEGFEGINAQTINSYLDTTKSCDASLTEGAILKVGVAGEKLYPLEASVEQSWSSGRPLVLKSAIILHDTIVPMAKQVKEELQFRKPYREKAQKTLWIVRKKMADNFGADGKVVFVGVHVRRTDFTNYLKERYKAGEVAGPAYYRHALSWMRMELAREAQGPVNIAFVVVSDDIKWCVEMLAPEMLKERIFTNSGDLGKFDVFPVGHGNIRSPLDDLAILSACNHSIIAYGTYGMSAALLAGGKTVVYDLEASEKNKNIKTVKDRIMSLIFVDELPDWVAVF